MNQHGTVSSVNVQRDFGLAVGMVEDLVRRVRPEDAQDDSEGWDELFARAAFGTLIEPADRVASLLIEHLGAAESLTAILERKTPAWFVDAVAAAATGTSEAFPRTEPEEDQPDAADGTPRTERRGVLARSAAEQSLSREVAAALERWQPRLNSAAVVASLRSAARVQAQLVAPWDDEWPVAVNDLELHAPQLLWLRGKLSTLRSTTRSIALVGARAATGYGEYLTIESSAGLVDRGFAIVSGGAYGIDGAAHRSALASGGDTLAFMAGGVDRLYPSGHESLLTRIATEGALVSELPCGTSPSKWRFLQRNRLIAACSNATVVLEAGRRSGAINTAGHAAQLGRPLGAAPGPVTSAASAGCHRLLREYDAVCVTSAVEMAELVPDLDSATHPGDEDQPPLGRGVAGYGIDDTLSTALSPADRILASMGPRRARSTRELARLTGQSLPTVQGQLGNLQLAGLVQENEHGWRLASAP